MTPSAPPHTNAVFGLAPVIEITDGGSPDGHSELFFVCLVRADGGRVVEERCATYAEARQAARRVFQRCQASAIKDLTDWNVP